MRREGEAELCIERIRGKRPTAIIFTTVVVGSAAVEEQNATESQRIVLIKRTDCM